jgi:hypothetical protein
LRSQGVTFTLDAGGNLAFTPELGPRGCEIVAPHRATLTAIAIGRITGHGIGECQTCGRCQMIGIVNSSGTARWAPSVGWPTCKMTPRCTGLVVISPDNLDGVKRPPRRKPRLIGPPRPSFDMRWPT